jgi:hypothetical protein
MELLALICHTSQAYGIISYIWRSVNKELLNLMAFAYSFIHPAGIH